MLSLNGTEISPKIYKVRQLIKALTTACHPNTGDAERLVALGLIHKLDPEARFIDLINPDFNVNSSTDEWRERLRSRDARIEELETALKAAHKDAARGEKTSSGRRTSARKRAAQPARSEDVAKVESKGLPYPLLHSRVLRLRIADKVWQDTTNPGTLPKGLGWSTVKRHVIEYLWDHHHVTTVEQIKDVFTLIGHGETTPGNYIPTLDITLKNDNTQHLFAEVKRALERFNIPYELTVAWEDVQRAKKLHSQPAAFPAMIVRLTSCQSAAMIGEAVDLANFVMPRTEATEDNDDQEYVRPPTGRGKTNAAIRVARAEEEQRLIERGPINTDLRALLDASAYLRQQQPIDPLILGECYSSMMTLLAEVREQEGYDEDNHLFSWGKWRILYIERNPDKRIRNDRRTVERLIRDYAATLPQGQKPRVATRDELLLGGSKIVSDAD